jgi:hypothetical protein
MPDIFDLSLWRHILIGGRGNQSQCFVSTEYRTIVDAYCRAQGRARCPTVPCTLLHVSAEFTDTLRCLRGGRVASPTGRFDWQCRKSPALALLVNRQRRPVSMVAEGFTNLTHELYGVALSPYHDGEHTQWGLSLEGESIGYYPSAALHHRVRSLFDITVGYDRRYFDLVTDRHLNEYVDRIVGRAGQRLSIEQVLGRKVKGPSSRLVDVAALRLV